MSGKLSRTVLRRGKGSNPFSLVDYASYEYQQALRNYQFVTSMSRKGNCYDNACMESFFGTLKMELIYGNRFKTRAEARQAVFEYIEIFYNRIRLHSSLGYMSPIEYEQSFKLAA